MYMYLHTCEAVCVCFLFSFLLPTLILQLECVHTCPKNYSLLCGSNVFTNELNLYKSLKLEKDARSVASVEVCVCKVSANQFG